MKILGEGKKGVFIVEMTGEEFAHLKGEYHRYDFDRDLKPGFEAPVSDMYKRADEIIKLHKELKGNLEKLKEHHDIFCALIQGAEQEGTDED